MLGDSSGAATTVFWLSIAGWMAAETVVFAHGRRVTAPGRVHDRGSVWPVLGSALLAFVLALIVADTLRSARVPATTVVFWLGIVVLWAGIVVRLWAVRTLGSFFQPLVVIQDEHRLVTAGPYRLIRHPSYSGALLTMFGIGLATGNPASIAVLVVIPVLGYLPRITVEERALSAALGAEYVEYQRVSARLVPGVW